MGHVASLIQPGPVLIWDRLGGGDRHAVESTQPHNSDVIEAVRARGA